MKDILKEESFGAGFHGLDGFPSVSTSITVAKLSSPGKNQ